MFIRERERLFGVVIIAIRESRGYILPKRPDLGRFGSPLHIHAGLKSVASLGGPPGTGRGTEKKSRRDRGENPDYS